MDLLTHERLPDLASAWLLDKWVDTKRSLIPMPSAGLHLGYLRQSSLSLLVSFDTDWTVEDNKRIDGLKRILFVRC